MQKRFNWQIPLILLLVVAVGYLFIQQQRFNKFFIPPQYQHPPSQIQIYASDSTMGGGTYKFINTWVVAPGNPIPPGTNIVITDNPMPPATVEPPAMGPNVDGTTFQVSSVLGRNPADPPLNPPGSGIGIYVIGWNTVVNDPADPNSPDITVYASGMLFPGDTIYSTISDRMPSMTGGLSLKTTIPAP